MLEGFGFLDKFTITFRVESLGLWSRFEQFG